MKKIIGILFMTLVSLTGAQAQGKGDVEFGIFGGYNSSNARTRYFETDINSGFNVGASADYYFSERWSLRVKAVYDKKGWDNDIFVDGAGNEFVADYNLDYLTIPVLANFHFGNTLNWYINVGPYAGILLKASETSHDTDLTEDFKSSDFGIAMGIGVKIPLNNKLKLMLEYDGQSGFSDIFDNKLNYNVMNSRSSFNVGLNFLMK